MMAQMQRFLAEPGGQGLRGSEVWWGAYSFDSDRAQSVAIVSAQVSVKPRPGHASQHTKPYRPSASRTPHISTAGSLRQL